MKGSERVKRRERWENLRVFFSAFFLTAVLLLAGIGAVTVDRECRRMTFGDSRPVLEKQVISPQECRLELRLFGQEKSLDISRLEKDWKFFLDFCCIPHK